jgi:hypothetical protein
MATKALLATMTGEAFQPVRLHYKVLDHPGLLRAFEKLRCIETDPQKQRWVWLYNHEAKKLHLPKAYSEIPADAHPIVIGSFFERPGDKLILDLRSCERALLAIPFFDKHLPRRVVKVTDAEVVNKLFAVAGNEMLTPDRIFDTQPSTYVDPAAVQQRLMELAAQARDPQEKIRIVMEGMEAHSKRPLADIERIPVHYYEDGIGGFQLALRTRQIVAMQHWQGNTSYTLMNAIQSITRAK